MALQPPAPAAQLLVVCTANVCRSPLAAETLRVALSEGGWLHDVTVVSGGTDAVDGQAMCVVSAAHLHGPDAATIAEEHRSHRVTPADVEAAGLVLTAERQHRGAIARLVPGSQSRVFTWREAIALAAAAEQRLGGDAERPADLAGLASLLHGMRGTVPISVPEPPRGLFARFRRPVEPPDPLTVPDGHGRSPAEHERAVAETATVAAELGDRLRALV